MMSRIQFRVARTAGVLTTLVRILLRPAQRTKEGRLHTA